MGHLHDTKETYLRLQRRVDKTQAGLPSTPELHDILRHLFTEEEATIGCKMPVVPRKLSTIARRMRTTSDALRPKLDRMADKGLVFDFHHPTRGSYYMLAPPVVGFFEFSMMRARSDIDQKQVAGLLSSYLYERPDFMRQMADSHTPIGRTLVNEPAIAQFQDPISTEVMDYERATEVIRSAHKGAVSMCYCRHKKSHLGEACANPVDVCLSLNQGADFVVRHGHGRAADTAEMLDILQRSRDLSLVQIADNVQQEPSYVCNCCGCCCGQLAAINRHGISHAVATSPFLAHIDPATCNGCGKCAKLCPIQAISLRPRPPHLSGPRRPKMNAAVDEEICLGCGVCKVACKQDALHMLRRQKRTLTPVDTLERVLRMAVGRGTVHDLLFDEHDGPTMAFANRLVGAIERLPLTRRAVLNETLRSRFVAFLSSVARKDRRVPAQVYE